MGRPFDVMTAFVNSWYFAIFAAVALVLTSICFRGETPEDRRARRRKDKPQKHAAKNDVDELLKSVVRKPAAEGPNANTASQASPAAAAAGASSAAAATGAAAAKPAAAPVAGKDPAAAAAAAAANESMPRLRWTQGPADVDIFFRIDTGIARKDITCVITASRLKLDVSGAMILQGELWDGVTADGCSWQINTEDGRREVWIQLEKATAGKPWRGLIKGGPELPDAALRAVGAPVGGPNGGAGAGGISGGGPGLPASQHCDRRA